MKTSTTTYAIDVAGHLDDHWSAWITGTGLTHNDDVTTTITLDAADQSQLHGVLARIRDIGAVLTGLRIVPLPSPVLARPLHTERLTLRPATADDAADTWAYRRLDTVNEWLTGTPHDLDSYRTRFAQPDRLASTVIVGLGHDSSAPIIGDFMLRREDAWAQLEVTDQARDAQAELGWALDPAHTDHGYATEAVRELLRYCFEELDAHRVTANCFVGNDSSRRLMERVGMRCELHAIGESLHRSGRWMDTLGYALLAEEWAAASSWPSACLGSALPRPLATDLLGHRPEELASASAPDRRPIRSSARTK